VVTGLNVGNVGSSISIEGEMVSSVDVELVLELKNDLQWLTDSVIAY